MLLLLHLIIPSSPGRGVRTVIRERDYAADTGTLLPADAAWLQVTVTNADGFSASAAINVTESVAANPNSTRLAPECFARDIAASVVAQSSSSSTQDDAQSLLLISAAASTLNAPVTAPTSTCGPPPASSQGPPPADNNPALRRSLRRDLISSVLSLGNKPTLTGPGAVQVCVCGVRCVSHSS